jgi:hypothetical protein
LIIDVDEYLGAAKWPVTDAQTEELKRLLSENCGKDKYTH